MPLTVVATSPSSSYAGTTTATRLPSSISAPLPTSRRERLPHKRGDETDHESEERTHDGAVASAARRVEACTVTATSGFPVALVPLTEVPVEMLLVEM